MNTNARTRKARRFVKIAQKAQKYLQVSPYMKDSCKAMIKGLSSKEHAAWVNDSVEKIKKMPMLDNISEADFKKHTEASIQHMKQFEGQPQKTRKGACKYNKKTASFN